MTRVPPEPEGQLPKHDFPPAFAASSLFSAVGREGSHTQHCLCTAAVTAISPSFSVTWHRRNSNCKCVRYTMHLMIDNVPTTTPDGSRRVASVLAIEAHHHAVRQRKRPFPGCARSSSHDCNGHGNGCATSHHSEARERACPRVGAVRLRLGLGQARCGNSIFSKGPAPRRGQIGPFLCSCLCSSPALAGSRRVA